MHMLVDRLLGAQHHTLFVAQIAPRAGHGQAASEHYHPFEEIYYFLSGGLRGRLDGDEVEVAAGDLIWAGVDTTHGFVNERDESATWLEAQSPVPPDSARNYRIGRVEPNPGGSAANDRNEPELGDFVRRYGARKGSAVTASDYQYAHRSARRRKWRWPTRLRAEIMVCYFRASRSSRQACSQRRQASAQTWQCGMWACRSHSSPQLLQIATQACSSGLVTSAS